MLNANNLILKTDSYKLTHAPMYPSGTTGVYSYLEARKGARDAETVFFGLQPILEKLEMGVTQADVDEAAAFTEAHIGPDVFNRVGWQRIVDVHDGRLPVEIKAVPEGTVVPAGNVLMTVENLDSQLPWLTNALESLLLHVWYPTTVASTSRSVRKMLLRKLTEAGSPTDGVDFMLHDFGYRGVSSDESAAIGGAAHLTSFMGTDTLQALILASNVYGAEMAGFSVPATEHSIMTSLGPVGEHAIVNRLLTDYPTGILSVVGDSYDIFKFTREVGSTFHDQIMERDGKFVVRPDSGDARTQVPELLEMLWDAFGGTLSDKGYKVLDPHVGVLWGDGLDGPAEIEDIVNAAMKSRFSPANLVFGMGGGLLQKVNRDTERFAFKCSAQRRNGVWLDVQKNPLDRSKASKPGRLGLVWDNVTEQLVTVREQDAKNDVLQTVFRAGDRTRTETFDEVRARAQA